MSTSLIPPAQWAQQEFGFAQLGDQRRNKRLVNIAEHLAANPGGTLPQAFSGWPELKAAYRFFGQTGVTFERVPDAPPGTNPPSVLPTWGVLAH